MGQNPCKTALVGLLANNGFYTHEPNRKVGLFTKAETSKQSLSITRTVWPKLRKAMPPGTHSVLLLAQVVSSVQEQQGHGAEGLWSGMKETGAGAFGNTIAHSPNAITRALSTHGTQFHPAT